MNARATRIKASDDRNKIQLSVEHLKTDAMHLPVEQLERIHQFRPDLIDIIIKQTVEEADFRRKMVEKVNRGIFVGNIVVNISAIVLCLIGVGGAILAGMLVSPWLGGVIATGTIGTLAASVVNREKSDK